MVVGLRSRTDSEAAWVDIGVDDLMKFRIVEHLYQHLGDDAEVDALAAALGFRSLEHTAVAVAELAHSGILRIEAPPGRPARCGLTADPARRAQLVRLMARSHSPEETAGLLEALARRSLARVRARLQA